MNPNAVISLHILLLPVGAVLIGYLMSAGYLVNHWSSHWQRVARPLFVMSTLGAICWLFLWLLLASYDSAQAVRWWVWLVPFLLFAQLAAWRAALAIQGWRVRRWFPWLWALAAIGGILGLWHSHWYLSRLGLVAAAYWVRPMHPGGLFWGMGILFVGAAFSTTMVLFKARRADHPGRRFYRWAGIVSMVLYISDALQILWFPRWNPFFPMVWVVGGLWLTITWVEIHRQMHWMEQQLQRDAMTTAHSRAYGQWYAAYQLLERPLGVAFCDLDDFKRINDHYGHRVGDLLLCSVVQRVGSVCRSKDMVVRIGGDEFLVVFPGVGAELGDTILSRLERALSHPPLAVDEMEVGDSVQFSLGWAWGPQGSNLETLMAEADQNMYADKTRKHVSRGVEPAVALRPPSTGLTN